MDDLTGTVIAGKYELLRLIGRGGMGAVYEGSALATLKRCAVKLLLTPELAGDDQVLKRFFREARASGIIQSQHVVTAFDSGVDLAGHPFYVMEYLVGEDLEQALSRLGPLNPTAVTKIAFQAALGLAKAHELGIVHRDVKPANLFLAASDDGEIKVKVLDFGVAKVKMELFNETSPSNTHAGSILGTPLYMSPEQMMRASAIDASADVWSLGVVLFECLTGTLPWGDVDGFGELVAAILATDLPLLQDRAPWVKPELAELTHRAISRDIGHRFPSAGELRDALKALLPDGPRLSQAEIGPPAEAERRSIAPRLSLADTVMLRPTFRPKSSEDAARTKGARRFNGASVALAATALALGTGAWKFARQARVDAPATAGWPIQVASATPVVSSTPGPVPARFQLEVAPAGAAVSVDGVPTSARDGKVELVGQLGATHSVRLTVSGQTVEERVAITAEGLIPPRIALVLAPPSGRPRHEPGAAPTTSKLPVAPRSDPTKDTTSTPAAIEPPSLAPEFN